MDVLTVPQRLQARYGVLGSNKMQDWTETLTTSAVPAIGVIVGTQSQTSREMNLMASAASVPPYLQCDAINKIKNKNSITKRSTCGAAHCTVCTVLCGTRLEIETQNEQSPPINADGKLLLSCKNGIPVIMNDARALSIRLLDELRAAKSRHLACTEVSLPCDLTLDIATEILSISRSESSGLDGCTVHIEFEDEPHNSRRIATLKLNPDTVTTFEIYLTLRQDHRFWASLLPQFMKNLTRTIKISPDFTIIKHKLYSPTPLSSVKKDISGGGGGIAFNRATNKKSSAAISTPCS